MIIYFTIVVLAHDSIGGLSGLYDKILAAEAAGKYYISGNFRGSMLTFKSKGAMMFALVHAFGNLALMTMVIPILFSRVFVKSNQSTGHGILAEILLFSCTLNGSGI